MVVSGPAKAARSFAVIGLAVALGSLPEAASGQSRVLSVEDMSFARLVVTGPGAATLDPSRLGLMETQGGVLALGDGSVGTIRFRCSANVDYEYHISPLVEPEAVSDFELLVLRADRPNDGLQNRTGVGACPADGIAELRIGGRLFFDDAVSDVGPQSVSLDIEIDLNYGRWMDGDDSSGG